MERYPFAYNPTESFHQQVSDWIADVFYDLLPEAGFEVRDEQIYMAFQMERAFAEKNTIFAEAGVGTGKTLVYLLYAVCYARQSRKPAIIACADESLIEQLVKPEGDIAKLARHLDLQIDARLGKSPDQYVCLNKLDQISGQGEDDERYFAIKAELPDFVYSPNTMQSFYPYGDRKEYPDLNDEQWKRIGWDPFQDCLVCDKRHRCGQTLSREHYRKSTDLIICSHDFYMEHVWTYEGRKREGQLPLLPEHSSVIFDEGHLLEAAAQKALTYKLKHSAFEEIVSRLLQGEVREELAVAVDEAIMHSDSLFERLSRQSRHIAGSDRKEIHYDEALLSDMNRLREMIAAIEEELVFESGLFSLDSYQLRIVEEHLEMMGLALSLFGQSEGLISWLTEDSSGLTLVIMPRLVKEVLKERVFSQQKPIIFSSATLSLDGSFDYVADSLGIEHYLSFSVESPYDYAEQMKLFIPPAGSDLSIESKLKLTIKLLQQTEGRALILFPSHEEMAVFKQLITDRPDVANLKFWYEGDREISHIISAFQQDEHSILCAVTLWEGLDIPGPSLSNVIIWSMPFPPHDPVYTAKRRASASPFEEVDMPYMLLRLRQGIGRLIRSREDHGVVAILGKEMQLDKHVREKVREVLPNGVEWKEMNLN
ncbi:ATP-dependent DNA helicase [Paenibacillus marinisediminis]